MTSFMTSLSRKIESLTNHSFNLIKLIEVTDLLQDGIVTFNLNRVNLNKLDSAFLLQTLNRRTLLTYCFNLIVFKFLLFYCVHCNKKKRLSGFIAAL
jgi:hypothetical protein